MTFQFLVPLPECERQGGGRRRERGGKKKKTKTKKNRCNFNTAAMSGGGVSWFQSDSVL